jgi:hypothetical protein
VRVLSGACLGRSSWLLNDARCNDETSQSKGWCVSAEGDELSQQASGAYMFRPATQHTQSCDDHHPVMSITEGPLVTEIMQTFAPWATHTIRLTKGSPYVEVEWTAGPIPLEAATGKSFSGKELVIKFGSDIRSAGTFYTDSNGREVRTTQTKRLSRELFTGTGMKHDDLPRQARDKYLQDPVRKRLKTKACSRRW